MISPYSHPKETFLPPPLHVVLTRCELQKTGPTLPSPTLIIVEITAMVKSDKGCYFPPSALLRRLIKDLSLSRSAMKCHGKENHIRWRGGGDHMACGCETALYSYYQGIKGYARKAICHQWLCLPFCCTIGTKNKTKKKHKDQAPYLRETERGLKIGDVL